eukprot:symbB.v1.2.023440.t1/scaffold2132.1/size88257/1
MPDDIDDFFDSLLADPVESIVQEGGASSSGSKAEAVEVTVAKSPMANGDRGDFYDQPSDVKSIRSKARLRLALTKFYASRKSDKLGNLDRIVERYDGRVLGTQKSCWCHG